MKRHELDALLRKSPFSCDDAWRVSLAVPGLITELETVWSKLLEGQRHADGSECNEVLKCGLAHVSKRAIDAASIKQLEAESRARAGRYEKVIDEHAEGAWMARALDAERELNEANSKITDLEGEREIVKELKTELDEARAVIAGRDTYTLDASPTQTGE